MYQEQYTPEISNDIHPDRQRQHNDESYEYRPRYRKHKIDAQDSILNTQWDEPERPFSQKELEDLGQKLYTYIQLSKFFVKHTECGHVYRIKKNGVRFKELMNGEGGMSDTESEENDTETDELTKIFTDVGNCSVCWKQHNSPRELSSTIDEFVRIYGEEIDKPTHRKSYYLYQVEKIFYTWLYKEFFY